MKILILGADGMLGHKMLQVLSEHFDVCGTVRDNDIINKPYRELFDPERIIQNLNVTNLIAVHTVVKEVQPDLVINCTGILKGYSSLAENNYHCILVNSLLPWFIASHLKKRLITFSSDCVFDGTKGDYTEEDMPNSPSLYGRTKCAGEVVGLENALTLRTSIIGRELKNFKMLLEWFLSQEGKTIKGYRKAIWSGISTNYLVKLVKVIIEKYPDLHGLYHVTSAARIRKHNLLKILKKAYGLDVEIETDDTFIPDRVCDRSLNGSKFCEATGWEPPFWDDMVKDLVDDLTPYEEWR